MLVGTFTGSCVTLKSRKQNFKAEPSYCPSQVITCVEWIPAQWVEDQGCLGIEVGVFQPGPRSVEHWGQGPPPIHYLHSKIIFFFKLWFLNFLRKRPKDIKIYNISNKQFQNRSFCTRKQNKILSTNRVSREKG